MSVFTFLEILATLSGIVCVALQTKEKVLAWPFGILSVTISAWIFFHSRLYSDFILHVVYIGLNIYGWYHWMADRGVKTPAPITELKMRGYFLFGGITFLLTAILGYLMGRFTDADLYYFDAFTTSGSLVAQYLLARKVLQNWLLWIVVDLVAVPVYLYKELYFFSALFLIYLFICVYGYRNWQRGSKPELATE